MSGTRWVARRTPHLSCSGCSGAITALTCALYILCHPQHLHGKYALHPFLDRRLPIITDAIAVDMSFGTGAVKMTPAHDPNDYEVGMRHKLDFINILNDDGTLNANAGPEFEGMKRFHARRKVVDEMKKKGLYVGDAENPMSIPVCAKSGDFIESVMKPQWWVSQKSLAEKAIEVRFSLFFIALYACLVVLILRSITHLCSAPGLASSRSARRLRRASGTGGSKTSRTGAFPGNCGGDTALRRTLSRSKARSRT